MLKVMSSVQLVNSPYTTFRIKSKQDGKTTSYENKPVWILGNSFLETSFKRHSIIISKINATSITYACNILDLQKERECTIKIHNQDNSFFGVGCLKSKRCTVGNLLPNSTHLLFYDIYCKDECLKMNIPLPLVSTKPWELTFIENNKQKVTNGMTITVKIRLNDPTFDPGTNMILLLNQIKVPFNVIVSKTDPHSFDITTKLKNLKHKERLLTSFKIDKSIFKHEKSEIMCLTHVEKCFFNYSCKLHHISVKCKTIYTQFVSCRVLLVQDDCIIYEEESEHTFECYFKELKSDTIYEIRVYITDELNQSTFTYCSVKTEAYRVSGLTCKNMSTDIISFGTQFATIQFYTNKRNIINVNFSLRNDVDNAVLVSWNGVQFSTEESRCVIEEVLEIERNSIQSFEIGFPVRMFITIQNEEEETFSTQLAYYFKNDTTDPKGTPHIETIATGTNSGSVRLTGYSDEKKGLFTNVFHLGCFGPFLEYKNKHIFGEKDVVEKGKRVDFHTLLPDTQYFLVCQVTSKATGRYQINMDHSFVTKVDPDYVMLYVSSNQNSKSTIVFETLHSQRLSFLIRHGSHVYSVKRHSLIQIHTLGKPILKLNTDDMNHYQLNVTTSLDYYGFQYGLNSSVHVCLESRIRRSL
jgi:hypothetical protein